MLLAHLAAVRHGTVSVTILVPPAEPPGNATVSSRLAITSGVSYRISRRRACGGVFGLRASEEVREGRGVRRALVLKG